MGEGVLVIGDFDGGQFPGGQVLEGLEGAVCEDEYLDFLILFEGFFGLLIEFANINFAEVELGGVLFEIG